jgi:phospholipid/cholesterol/gamma-HCH transport system ATP-binding protein
VEPIVEVRGLSKRYAGLRPLRVSSLSIAPAERVAILGLDEPAAEVFVNVLTGATLPDEGEVRLFGRQTLAITDADDWMATLDRIGMVSLRAVLVETLTVRQAVAMAFTLSLDPVPEAVSVAVQRLAREAGLPEAALDEPVASAEPLTKARCRLARALALDPAVLVLEHANALVPEGADRFGREIAALADSRATAVLALTADPAFARAVGNRVFALDGATGGLKDVSGWRRWLAS